jgi:hypothetical protein
VAAVTAWNCWDLRSVTDAAAYLDDASLHEQMARYATSAFDAGRDPLTGWFPYLSLGSPQFLHYQSLGATLTGLAGAVIGPDLAFRWSLFLMVGFWPVAVYVSAKLFGLGRGAAASAAVLSPFVASVIGIGYERGAYLWVGFGVWAQLWGSWALPFAWALIWRALHDRRLIWAAAALVGLTTALHFETGYLAFLGVGVLTLAAVGPLGARLVRGAAVFATGLATSAWVVVPLALTSRWTALNEALAGTPLANGYGSRRDLLWLFTGRTFDSGRFPVISLALLCGVAAAAVRWRRRDAPTAALALFVASLMLSFGPATWGSLVDAIPGHADLFFRRFTIGAQLAGLYLAGVGAAAAARAAAGPLRKAWRWVAAGEETGSRAFVFSALSFFAVLLVWPAASQTAALDARNAAAVSAQRAGEAVQGAAIAPLLSYIKVHGGGRTYAGDPGNWGPGFRVGAVPVFKYLEAEDVDEVGYTLRTESLMTAPECHFDQWDPSDYALFGVRYLLLPTSMASPVPAQRVMVREGYTLWAIPGSGYVSIVRVTGTISADRADVGRRTAWLLRSDLASRHEDWAVNWAGQRAVLTGVASAGPPGMVMSTQADLLYGRLTAAVDLSTAATVLVSVSYDYGWRATVDGRPARTEMLAPAVLGVEVPPGAHRVTVTYAGPGGRWWLSAGGAAVLVTAAWLGRRRPPEQPHPLGRAPFTGSTPAPLPIDRG